MASWQAVGLALIANLASSSGPISPAKTSGTSTLSESEVFPKIHALNLLVFKDLLWRTVSNQVALADDISAFTNCQRFTYVVVRDEHTEAAVDITESDIVASPVALNPKLLACTIPLTVEVVADSPNLDAVLNMALAGAFAAKLDALCIATLLGDTNIPDSAAGQDPAVWAKLLEAVGAALALNQRLPSAHISAPADWIARASQLASTAGTWLGKPPALAGMAELHTTGLTAGTALFGNFAEAFAIALRSDLRVEVVRHAKPTSASHLLVAHMRADGVVLQPGHLFKQLKTV